MRGKVWLSFFALGLSLIGQSSVQAEDKAPPAAEVTAVGQVGASSVTTISIQQGGKMHSSQVFACLLHLNEQATLLAIVDLKHFPGDTDADRFKNATMMIIDLVGDEKKRCAIKGRLVSESKGMNLGGFDLRTKEMLTLPGKKRLILVGDSFTRLDDKNQDRYPAKGTVWVQGKPVCGKEDLKLVAEPTLAVVNEGLPVLLEGEKARTKPGKNPIRVIGTLQIDDKGLLRLKATQVEEVK